MITNKEYDFSSLNKFFNEFETPQQLADKLVQLLFNYAACVDEDSLMSFKNDVSTIYVIHSELNNIK